MSEPKPVDRTALVLALFAFGLVNLAVILYFAGLASKPVLTGLLVAGGFCGLPAWIRLRRS